MTPDSQPWPHALVRILATDAWIPVSDSVAVKEFEADAAYEVHRIPNPAALLPFLQHVEDGAVRATRELLGMLALPDFRAFAATLTGQGNPKRSSKADRRRERR